MEIIQNKFLDEIKQREGNNKCFDCGSDDNEWISLTYGTFLCINCAGTHRSLGVHRSFVRSTKLDSLSQEAINRLDKLGNKKVREKFDEFGISNLPIEQKYNSKEAVEYAQKIEKEMPIEGITKISDYIEPKTPEEIAAEMRERCGSCSSSSFSHRAKPRRSLCSLLCPCCY